jgi:hypothetical protein
VNESEIGRLLLNAPVPDELEAQRRAWAVVRAAYADREPLPWRRRRLRPLLAFAVVLALIGAALSPPGQAVSDWLRERVAGKEEAEPALFRLPGSGRLLVLSERGPWIVRGDGSKRLLGAYAGADFSPRGLFVVVTRGRRLVAVEPDGDPRWSLTRREPPTQARWSPSGFRVAYRTGTTLRVVAGDGTGDRLLARRVASVAPAWRPGGRHVLAYADGRGRVHVVDVDTRRGLWRTGGEPDLRQLLWSADGRRLLAVTARSRHPLFGGGGELLGTLELPPGRVLVDAAFAPRGTAVAYTEFDRDDSTSTVVLARDGTRRVAFRGAGRLGDVAWSPNARWLLVGWPDADQWLFLRMPGVRRIVAVEGMGREFDPGDAGGGRFPSVARWCC